MFDGPDRSGAYPPPPSWPGRLTDQPQTDATHPLHPLHESGAVQHDFIADGWPGPCWISFRNEAFAGWWPALTIERAERFAREA